MRVKIIKARPQDWYFDNIGDVYSVKKLDPNSRTYSFFIHGYTILNVFKSHCEILPDEPTFQDGINEGFETGMDYIKSNPDKVVITKEEYADLIANQRVPETPPQPEPFDLERALKGEVFISKDGITRFRIVGPSSFNDKLAIVESITDHRIKIELINPENIKPEYNFMAPKEPQVMTRWVNVYHNTNRDNYNFGVFFTDEFSAIKNGEMDKDYIKTIAITFTI